MKAAADEEDGSGRVRRTRGFVDEAFELIRADIMSLKIPPNTRIPIGKLVQELGVSQTPIREALSMLEVAGLVTKKQFVGYCTAPRLNRRQFDELYEMRLLVEPFAARRAAEKITDAELEEIRDLIAGMEPGETRASYNLFADQDSDLHARIARASGNSLIEKALSRLHVHLHIFRLRFHSEVTTEAYAEHERLVDALARRSPAEAEAAMSFHIQRSYDRLVSFTEL